MGSLHDFGLQEALALPGLVRALHGQYTDVINVQGDFREEILGILIGSKHNWSPVWPADHPCSKVIRQSVVPLANSPVPILSNQPNVHDAVATVGKTITGASARKPALYTPLKLKIDWSPVPRAVGIHPMASQPCRRWEMEKWSVVAGHLVECGLNVHIFGSPAEEKELTEHFGQLDATKVRIVTGNLRDYFAAVSRMNLLLCPDSFAAHVAYALDVPTILLNGANEASAWSPPGTTVLAGGPGLDCYPCYNRPTCVGTAGEYACIRRIEIKPVIETVWDVLKKTGGT